MKKRRILRLVVCFIAFTSCNGKTLKNEPQSKSFFAMDTYMTITAYGENAETAFNQARERVTIWQKQ